MRKQKLFPSFYSQYFQQALVFLTIIGILAVASIRIPKVSVSGDVVGKVFRALTTITP